ncbi:unnamed protein product [Timema podura]|uniref:BRCA2 OB3 domain-containing protein n=1 Tax=Timema podura TaxID=61482 RepID=A0ABN7NMM3_TIMPD|nr:unnamed protein product [Timema podura]
MDIQSRPCGYTDQPTCDCVTAAFCTNSISFGHFLNAVNSSRSLIAQSLRIDLDHQVHHSFSASTLFITVYVIILLVSLATLYQICCFFNPFFSVEMLVERNSLSIDVQQKASYPERVVIGLNQLANKDFNPTFGEIDIVGVVVCNDSPQTVFLADADYSLLAVTFWGNAKELGYEDILVPQSVVSASNLQWKQGLSSCNNLLPRVYATEMSTFSSHPRQAHLKQALHTLRGEISVDLREFVSSCKDKLKSLLQQTNKVTTPVPYKASNSTSPLRQTRTFKLVTPLHKPLNNNAEDIKPPSAAERKLIKLELYGDPPPLSPLVLPRPRGTLRKEFKAPQRISHSPVHSETSPPLSLDSLSE